MEKQLVLDMDGTFVDLYGVQNWLPMLKAESVEPYTTAEPLYDIDVINALLDILKGYGFRIIVVSWTAKNGSRAYNQAVRKAKIEWLKAHKMPIDEIHIVKYGTPKYRLVKGNAILIDDEEPNRNSWTRGKTIDPTNRLIDKLLDLVTENT